VSHRTRKQSLALGSCQCFSFAARLQHEDLVVEAFNVVRPERQRQCALPWKVARARAAARLGRAVLNGRTRIAA
jgi:hypothetical protein